MWLPIAFELSSKPNPQLAKGVFRGRAKHPPLIGIREHGRVYDCIGQEFFDMLPLATAIAPVQIESVPTELFRYEVP
jgi:hypothetical protein